MDPRYERWRWQSFGLTWLIYASYYLTRKSFAVAKVAFDDDAKVTLTREQYGYIDSAYLTTYMIGQFVSGACGDRYGPRIMLILGMAFSVAASVGSAFSASLAGFLAFAILQGAAQSTGWSNTTKVMSAWFSMRERGKVVGWWCTHFTVGAAVASPLAGYMMNLFGESRPGGQQGVEIVPYWPAGFLGPAAILGVVLLLALALLRNRPRDVGLPSIEEYHGEGKPLISKEDQDHPLPSRSWRAVGEVMALPSVWLLGLSYFAIKLTRYSFYFWGPKYVSEQLGTGVYTSALTSAALPIGGVVGVVLGGYASDNYFQSRRAPVAIISLVAASGVLLVGLNDISDRYLMGAFFFVVGVFLFCPDALISGTSAMDFGTKEGAGTAAGLINGIGSLGGILGGFLPSVLTTSDDWSALFYVFLVGLLISAALLGPLWNAKPTTVDD